MRSMHIGTIQARGAGFQRSGRGERATASNKTPLPDPSGARLW